jgi:hypothetical protein
VTGRHRDAGTPFADLHGSAVEFLEAVSVGDDGAVALAARLAEQLLDHTSARLALAVLEGGPLAITRAIRLAEHVVKVLAPAPGGERGTAGGAS